MDAMSFVVRKNAAAVTAEDRKAVRVLLAEALRDLADEIDKGERIVTEIQTQESVAGGVPTGSAMFLRTVLKK